MLNLKIALKKTFSKSYFCFLTVSVFLNVLFLYYFILLQTTSWSVFWQSNTAIYNWLQIIFSLANAILIGVAMSMLLFLIEQKRPRAPLSFLQTLGSFVFSAAATGCPVCGAFLLPLLGIAASLTALPLAGLEIKFLSALLLVYVIYEYSKSISGVCDLTNSQRARFNFFKKTLPQLKPIIILGAFILVIFSLPKLPKEWRIDFRPGFTINAVYTDLGPKMLSLGVINLDKFRKVYEQTGKPLTDEQLEILTKGSQQKIKITSKNSYFLLNFFWALGLANKNIILTEGTMTKYGQDKISTFASTGGWSLGKSEAMAYYAKEELIKLTPPQQSLLEKVSGSIYRPCCNNPTSFPDCNHGMALLGVLELLVANGASEQEMYEAAKYFNASWFSQSYDDLALYFKAKEGKDFQALDPKVLLSQDFSSVSGWQNTKNWLDQKGIIKKAPKAGVSCGV